MSAEEAASPLRHLLAAEAQARIAGDDETADRIARVLAGLVGAPGVAPEARIDVTPGRLADAIRETCDALRAAGSPIYTRGDVVRIYRAPEPTTDSGIRRPAGAVVVRPVTPEWLRSEMARVAHYYRVGAREARWVDPPMDIARIIAAEPDVGGWPPLRAVIGAPTVLPDGTIVARPGYDARTGLYLDGPEIPELRPYSAAEARQAASELRHMLRHYVWVDETDEAVAIALLVTAVVRPGIDAAPMIAVDSPAPGSGKSLLVDAAAIIATGRRAPVMDYGRDPVEAGKRLDAALLAGDGLLAIDNVEAPLEGAALCQTLTQPARRIRVLGSHRQAEVPTTCLVVATGNNLTLRGDIVRRAVVCRIDPGVERPELRRIDQDLLAEVTERRAELLRHIIGIVAGYLAAGDRVTIPPLGSYHQWTGCVREPIVWCGLPDPAGTMERTRAADPSVTDAVAVFSAWRSAGPEGWTAAEAIEHAESDPDLREALAQVCLRGGRLDARTLSYWLRARRDWRVGGMVLRARRGHRNTSRWVVEGLSHPSSGGDGGDGGDISTNARQKTKGIEGAKTSPLSPPSPPASRNGGLKL
ncbi:MAG: hypothetical protein Kow00109_04340 [Acidobacteriota bacterium]